MHITPSLHLFFFLLIFLQVDNFINDAIHYGGQDTFSNSLSSVNPGYCLKCGSYRDIESSSAAVSKAWKPIRR